MRKLKIIVGVLIMVGVVYLIIVKPRKVKSEYQPYFAQMNAALTNPKASP